MIAFWLTVYALVGLVGSVVLVIGAVLSYKDYVKEGFGIGEFESS